jgi:hypothetical protein
MMSRQIEVNDRMQSGYGYVLSAPTGKGFHAEFEPDLTPAQMLQLGVFGGKYMTDTTSEFPSEWFIGAKLSPSGGGPGTQLLRGGRQPATFRLAGQGVDSR